jgi:hypothetical protein
VSRGSSGKVPRGIWIIVSILSDRRQEDVGKTHDNGRA